MAQVIIELYFTKSFFCFFYFATRSKQQNKNRAVRTMGPYKIISVAIFTKALVVFFTKMIENR